MDGQPAPAQHEPWALRVAGDEGLRKAGDNLRDWGAVDVGRARRLVDRLTGKEDLDPKDKGLLGEKRVGRELDRLGEEWTVVHGVRVNGKGDVDHLVIGPGGVFSLNAKQLDAKAEVVVSARQLRVNGYSRDYYPKAVEEASRVEVRLQAATGHEVPVHPVLVIVGVAKERFRVKAQPTDVTVVHRRSLLRWLRSQPARLSEEQVRLLTFKVRRPATWDPSRAAVVLDRPMPKVPRPVAGPSVAAPTLPVPPPPSAAIAPATPHAVPSPPPVDPDADLVRWRRYGHDRLYVNCAATGQRLGWRDEKTGEVHVETADLASRVQRALATAPWGATTPSRGA